MAFIMNCIPLSVLAPGDTHLGDQAVVS